MASQVMTPTEVITEDYAIYNTDCVDFTSSLPDNSLDMVLYSPPFCGLYNYSSDERDMSNCETFGQFYEHYGFLVKELARTTKPGRANYVHVTDIPDSNVGRDSLHDLPGEVIRLHQQNGFRFIGRHTIWKEPLWVRLRTLQKSLQHQTVVEDAMCAGVAGADYLLVFAADGDNNVPVTYPTGFDYYAGESPMPEAVLKFKNFTGHQTGNKYSQWIWRQYASSVWDDIRQDRVLPFKPGKEKDDERHVHPLQLDVIERAVMLRTNPGETVFTPFLGVGSEAYGAVSLGRKALGTELKASYFRQAEKNLSNCHPPDRESITTQSNLMDLLDSTEDQDFD